MGGGLERKLLHDPEFGASGSWVGGEFFGGGSLGFATDPTELGRPRASEIGDIDWAIEVVVPGEALSEVLDDAVFSRVEGEDDESAAGAEGMPDGGQTAEEGAEFVIGGHPEGLEAAGGWVNGGGPAGGRSGDEVSELSGAGEGVVLAFALDGAGDSAGIGFVSKIAEDAGERIGRGEIDPVGGGSAGSGVEAHVKGAIVAEAEAACWGIELRGGDAEVEESCLATGGGNPGRNIGEVAESEVGAVFESREACVACAEGIRVAVAAEETAGRGIPFEDCLGVGTAAQGPVEDPASGLGIEGSEHFAEHDGLMVEFGHRLKRPVRAGRRGVDQRSVQRCQRRVLGLRVSSVGRVGWGWTSMSASTRSLRLTWTVARESSPWRGVCCGGTGVGCCGRLAAKRVRTDPSAWSSHGVEGGMRLAPGGGDARGGVRGGAGWLAVNLGSVPTGRKSGKKPCSSTLNLRGALRILKKLRPVTSNWHDEFMVRSV